MSIFLARHGETDWNIAKRVQGTTDIPLNENGLGQAELLRRSLAREEAKLCRIYSSGQKRALKTAEIVGSGFHVPVKVIPGLEEMNLGLFEGHTWEEIEALYPDEYERWKSDKRYSRAPGGESYQDLLERVFAALERIMREAREELGAGRDILILTHGAVIMSLLALKKDMDFETAYLYIDVENAKALRLESEELWEIRKKLGQDGFAANE